jgi:hypothetical protein
VSDIDRILEDLEPQLDVLEGALASGRPLEPTAPFVPPDSPIALEGATRERAAALQAHLVAAQALVAAELERTRRELTLTGGSSDDTPRFLDTTF